MRDDRSVALRLEAVVDGCTSGSGLSGDSGEEESDGAGDSVLSTLSGREVVG